LPPPPPPLLARPLLAPLLDVLNVLRRWRPLLVLVRVLLPLAICSGGVAVLRPMAFRRSPPCAACDPSLKMLH